VKKTFSHYYPPSDAEFKELWQSAVIVVDANVVLNLYRYPEQARDDLLDSLAKFSNRLWIPYYAALEYQRNRLTVIADQKKRFREVEEIIEQSISSLRNKLDGLQLKRRHSTIEVDEFLATIDTATGKFQENLSKLSENQNDVQSEDHLRTRIDQLFEGLVGKPPTNQKDLDQLWKEGAERYSRRMPPGYMDQKKEKDNEPDEFQFDGLVFRRSFGDLLLWQQIISYAKENQMKNVILVTDDEKEDWWWTIDSGGKRRIGPRPELTNEITREAGVVSFFMYNSEQFLRRASEFLKVQVPEESISQVRDIRVATVLRHEDFMRQRRMSESAVGEWLRTQFPNGNVVEDGRGFPDFTVTFDDPASALGFEVVSVRSPMSAMMRLRETAYRAYYEVAKGNYSGITLVVVIDDPEIADRIYSFSKSDRMPDSDHIRCIIGLVDVESDGIPEFRPIYGAND